MTEKEDQEKEIWEKNIVPLNGRYRFIQKLKHRLFGVKPKTKTLDDVDTLWPSSTIMKIFYIGLSIIVLDLLIRLGMDVYTFFNPPVDPSELFPKVSPLFWAIISQVNPTKSEGSTK